MSMQNQVKITIRQFAGDKTLAECQCSIKIEGCSITDVISFQQTGSHTEYELTHELVCFASRFNLVQQLHEICQLACNQFGQQYGINLYRKFNFDFNTGAIDNG